MTLLFVSTLTAQAHAATYYVAQNSGSDANAGSQSAPFQTIQKCANVAVSGDSCLVRAGTYRETVKPANNGVIFAPDGNVSVTVSGADVVSGWTAYQGNIYKSSGMTWDLGVNYNQVFLDGQMMNLARWPNTSLDVSHPTWAKAEGGFPTVESDSDVPWGIDDSHLTQSDGFWDGAEITQMSADYYAQGGVVTAYSR